MKSMHSKEIHFSCGYPDYISAVMIILDTIADRLGIVPKSRIGLQSLFQNACCFLLHVCCRCIC